MSEPLRPARVQPRRAGPERPGSQGQEREW